MEFRFKSVLAGLAMVLASGVAAAAYPEKPVTLIHGFGAGGNADSVARLVAAELESRLKQPFVVESRTGAGGTIASGHVAKAPADGYTLIMLTGGHTASAAVRKSVPYDPVADFSMISTVTQFPFVVAVSADNPAKTLAQLLETARGKADGVSFSSVGVGSTQHLTGELLASTAKAPMLHIPYRGGGAPVVSVIAGDVDVLVDTATVAGPQIQAGKLRALAVTSSEPWPLLPDVPPANKALPGFEVMSWLGLAAPAGTPADVIGKLNATLEDILKDPGVRKKLNDMGSEPYYSSPDGMRDMIRDNIVQWKHVVQQAQIPQQ